MECVIRCVKPLRNTMQIITLKADKIYYDDGRYERVILNSGAMVEKFCEEIYKIIFSWRQEYIGNRVYDGERYLIEVNINHKRKKYKIENKFPDNWEKFMMIKEKILSFSGE